MVERQFPSERYRHHDARSTSIAAGLAEEMLEELSRSDHSWTRLAAHADRLTAVIAQMLTLEGRPDRCGPATTSADPDRPNPAATSPEED